MRIGVCGLGCEVCPRLRRGTCPAGEDGCTPRPNPFCAVCRCAHAKGVKFCFDCPAFPCETTKEGPIAYDECLFLAGKEE